MAERRPPASVQKVGNLDAADVGALPADEVGEGFLGQAALLAVLPDVPAPGAVLVVKVRYRQKAFTSPPLPGLVAAT